MIIILITKEISIIFTYKSKGKNEKKMLKEIKRKEKLFFLQSSQQIDTEVNLVITTCIKLQFRKCFK